MPTMRIPYKLHELLLKFSAYRTFCEGEQSEQITEAVDRLNKALYIHKTRRLRKEDEKLSYYYFWSYSTNHCSSPPPHYVILWSTYPATYSDARTKFCMHGPMSITIREIDKMIDNLSSCGEEFIDPPKLEPLEEAQSWTADCGKPVMP
jgi:hypothetical protein